MKKRICILLAVLMLLGLSACKANEAAEKSRGVYAETSAPQRVAEYEVSDDVFYGNAASGENLNTYSYYSHSKSYNETPVSATDRSTETPAAETGRKLIRKISLIVETDDYQAFLDAITAKLLALGGYIEDMEASNSGRTPRATIIVRVPADQLSTLTESVSGIGNVTYKHESQQDVTLQYADTESHIAALRTEQDRLLQLLGQAENLSEILEIEDRMTYVRYQLESYERSLRELSNQVEYATATIEVTQVEVFTPTEEPGYWENIGNGILGSLKGLWEFVTELFSDFIIFLPYLLLFLGIPLIVLIVLIKRFKHKRREKKAARQAQSAPDDSGEQPR